MTHAVTKSESHVSAVDAGGIGVKSRGRSVRGKCGSELENGQACQTRRSSGRAGSQKRSFCGTGLTLPFLLYHRRRNPSALSPCQKHIRMLNHDEQDASSQRQYTSHRARSSEILLAFDSRIFSLWCARWAVGSFAGIRSVRRFLSSFKRRRLTSIHLPETSSRCAQHPSS